MHTTKKPPTTAARLKKIGPAGEMLVQVNHVGARLARYHQLVATWKQPALAARARAALDANVAFAAALMEVPASWRPPVTAAAPAPRAALAAGMKVEVPDHLTENYLTCVRDESELSGMEVLTAGTRVVVVRTNTGKELKLSRGHVVEMGGV